MSPYVIVGHGQVWGLFSQQAATQLAHEMAVTPPHYPYTTVYPLTTPDGGDMASYRKITIHFMDADNPAGDAHEITGYVSTSVNDGVLTVRRQSTTYGPSPADQVFHYPLCNIRLWENTER